MKLSDELRSKYQRKAGGKMRHGYLDVIRLCDMVDSLESILRRVQHSTFVDQQNEIQAALAMLDQ